jgi:hypothetical protein
MARDALHQTVRTALEKDGWTITNDPLGFSFELFNLMLDLGAERVIGLQRGLEKIAVEIKGFGAGSLISEFHATLGQYQNYQSALELRDPERKLYLAVPRELFDTFFQADLVQYSLKRNSVALLVYDVENEVIVQWIHKPI